MHLKISIFADVSDTTDSGKFIWDTVKDANPNHVCPVIAICREGSLDQIQTAVSSEIIDDLLFSPLEVSVLKRRIKANIHPDKNNFSQPLFLYTMYFQYACNPGTLCSPRIPRNVHFFFSSEAHIPGRFFLSTAFLLPAFSPILLPDTQIPADSSYSLSAPCVHLLLKFHNALQDR